ncbi:MAG: polysaccharide biosynthesis tyrosine autokinase [Pseudoxanthomonas sp.]
MSDTPMQPPAGDDDRQKLPTTRTGALERRSRGQELSLEWLEEPAKADPDEIDLMAYWRILRKRRGLVAACVAACLLLALLLTMLTTPLYRATAVLQVEKQTQQIVQGGDLAGPAFSAAWDPEFLATQVGLLKSQALAERVTDDLGIDQATLKALRPPGWIQRLKALVSPGSAKRSAAEQADADATATSAPQTMDPETVRKIATKVVRGGLSVQPQPNTRLVSVSFVSTEPKFAARVANAAVDGFIASEIDRRFGANSYAKKYLEEQISIAKGQLEDNEKALVEFAQQESLVDTGDGRSLVGHNLSDLNSQLAGAQAKRIRAQSRWQQVGSSGALPQDVLAGSLVPSLRGQLAELRRRYQERLQVFKPDYPEMQQLKGQMDELERQVAAEMSSARASLRAEYDAAIAEERMLEGQLASLRHQTLDTDNRSIRYNILRRDADTSRQLYDSLLQRYTQIAAASDVRPNNISVVDRAEPPNGPFKPSLFYNLAISVLLGLMLGVALAILLEFMDDTLKTPEDIERQLKLPVLGIVPRISTKKSLTQVAADPRSAFSESYRSVRTALQFSTEHGVPRVLLVTSSGPGEGKSTSALALARNFAQLGKRVLLVEADLRNPSLARTLQSRPAKGLSSLLAGNGTIEEAVVHKVVDGLDVMFAGPLPPNPVELLAGRRMRDLLETALAEYDQIIIDGPPVMGIADSPVLAHVGEATLLVVHSGRTRISDAQSSLKRLRASRTRLLGVLLTQYDVKVSGHGYRYEGSYDYGLDTPRLGNKS